MLGKTGERVALRGSFYKKRACMRPDVDRDDVIRAADCYRRAYALQPKAYHENNARQLAAIVSRWTTDVDLTVGFDRDTSARSRDVTPVDFWGRSGLADGMLTRLVEKALLARPYDGTVVEMATRYAAAFELRSNAANRRSVIEHLDDIATLLPGDVPLQAELADNAAAMRARWLVR